MKTRLSFFAALFSCSALQPEAGSDLRLAEYGNRNDASRKAAKMAYGENIQCL